MQYWNLNAGARSEVCLAVSDKKSTELPLVLCLGPWWPKLVHTLASCSWVRGLPLTLWTEYRSILLSLSALTTCKGPWSLKSRNAIQDPCLSSQRLQNPQFVHVPSSELSWVKITKYCPGRVKTSEAPIRIVIQDIPIQTVSDLLEDEEIILKFKAEKRTDLEAVIKCHMLLLTHWKVVN